MNPGMQRQSGREWAALVEDRRRRYVTTLLDALGSRRLRWRRSHSTDHALPRDAAKHAARLTGIANHIRRKLGFLEHRHFLRDRARLHQFSRSDQARNRFDYGLH